MLAKAAPALVRCQCNGRATIFDCDHSGAQLGACIRFSIAYDSRLHMSDLTEVCVAKSKVYAVPNVPGRTIHGNQTNLGASSPTES
jgi:hypothetical protein